MRFLDMTLCAFLSFFLFPPRLIRWIAFRLSLRVPIVSIFLLPLALLGFVFYMLGGWVACLLLANRIRRNDFLLSELEKLRTDNSLENLDRIKKVFREENIPFELFEAEQKRFGIFAKVA